VTARGKGDWVRVCMSSYIIT